MKATLEDIFAAIRREREYQTRKWGSVDEHPHEVMGYIGIMQSELAEAHQAWCKGRFGADDLREVLQVVAVGVACLEQHGVVEREELAPIGEINADDVVSDLVSVVSSPYFHELSRLDDDSRYWYCEFLVGDRYLSSPSGNTKWEACRKAAKFLKEHVELWTQIAARSEPQIIENQDAIRCPWCGDLIGNVGMTITHLVVKHKQEDLSDTLTDNTLVDLVRLVMKDHTP